MSTDSPENRKVGDKVTWANQPVLYGFRDRYGPGPFTIAKVINGKHMSGSILTSYELEEIKSSTPSPYVWDHSFFANVTVTEEVSSETFTLTCTNPCCKRQYVVTERKDCCGSCCWELE